MGRLIDEVAKDIRQENLHKWLDIKNYGDNSRYFHSINPFFYDKQQLFWMWNKELFKWEYVDDIDLLNKLEEVLNIHDQTITKGLKGNYIEALKRVGRRKTPIASPTKWIQFKDVAFSLKSGNLYQVLPNYFFTNPIKWEMGISIETPTMDKLFLDWVGEKYVQTLYEIIAYCCYRGYPIQCLFCLFGNGRNGKSQYLKILNKFLGEDNTTTSHLDALAGNNHSRFESFKMYKKLVCQMGETNFQMLDNTSILKQLTGGDMISYEMKNKQPFCDYNYAKIIISSNSLPSSNDTSDGFYRRWVIIPFDNEFKEGKDIFENIPDIEYNNLAKKITVILPKLLDNGCFTNQGSVEDRKTNYIMASNPLSLFLNTFCVREPSRYIKAYDLFNAYKMYLMANKRRVVALKSFYTGLEDEGLFSIKSNRFVDEYNNIREHTHWIDGIVLVNNWKDMLKAKKEKSAEKGRSAYISHLPQLSILGYTENVGTESQIGNPSLISPSFSKDSTDWLIFDEKCLVWKMCGMPVGDSICGGMPCNEYDGICYCKECFKKVTEQQKVK